ncbi:MAG: RND family transporter, partial [Thiopseudomonas sp.]|nr:RND family transporter [Thiopseudomonas sp.]
MTGKSTSNPAAVIERLIFSNRPWVILICALISVFLFWQAAQVRPETSFEKMIPLQHPYIENMLKYKDDLSNLGNSVRISVETTEGDIFDKDYMETLKQISDE